MNNNPYTLTFGKSPDQIIERIVQTDEVVNTFNRNPPVQQTYIITGVRGSGKENHQYYLPIGLKNVTVTDARDIRYRAFYNCTMISTLKINNTVNKEIGDEAFYNSRVPVYF